MTICMNEFLCGFSLALDAAGAELCAATTNHSRRVQLLCIAMGQHLGMTTAELHTLSACALLRNSGITEYLATTRPPAGQIYDRRAHCETGKRNLQALFPGVDAGDTILYHHERADGMGPFGKQAGEIPPSAALLAIADSVDAETPLNRISTAQLREVYAGIRARTSTSFTPESASALLSVLDAPLLESLRDQNLAAASAALLPRWQFDLRDPGVTRMAALAARIVDFKSAYTRQHSAQVANIAWWMAGFYGYSSEMCAQVYLAGALHDVGMLFIPTSVLEKPGNLSLEEYAVVKSHVWWTQETLSGIQNFETISHWAVGHHERLDGSGYPEKLADPDVDFVSRLLCCIDIYQALTEERPTHAPASHQKAIQILHTMAASGKLDTEIVQDLDHQISQLGGQGAPAPLAYTL